MIGHEPSLSYTTDDDGIHIVCSCGQLDESLGFDPAPARAQQAFDAHLADLPLHRLLAEVQQLGPADRLALIDGMGFTRHSSSHTAECPYAIDAGYRCNCVPDPIAWYAPKDIQVHMHDTYEDRRARPKERIYEVER